MIHVGVTLTAAHGTWVEFPHVGKGRWYERRWTMLTQNNVHPVPTEPPVLIIDPLNHSIPALVTRRQIYRLWDRHHIPLGRDGSRPPSDHLILAADPHGGQIAMAG